jgi:hypothetical protein
MFPLPLALKSTHSQPFPSFPSRSQCTKCPLCLQTHPAYIKLLTATAAQLPVANHRKSSGLLRIIVAICWLSSKKETKEFSTPANEEREEEGTRVWVSCCVVRSKIQRPRRERERKVKRGKARVRDAGAVVGSDVVLGNRWDRSEGGAGMVPGERAQSERTTGT